jgi:hypothetical protein
MNPTQTVKGEKTVQKQLDEDLKEVNEKYPLVTSYIKILKIKVALTTKQNTNKIVVLSELNDIKKLLELLEPKERAPTIKECTLLRDACTKSCREDFICFSNCINAWENCMRKAGAFR